MESYLTLTLSLLKSMIRARTNKKAVIDINLLLSKIFYNHRDLVMSGCRRNKASTNKYLAITTGGVGIFLLVLAGGFQVITYMLGLREVLWAFWGIAFLFLALSFLYAYTK